MISSSGEAFRVPSGGETSKESPPWRVWFALLFLVYATQITPDEASQEMN
jgi:hypothetical protein